MGTCEIYDLIIIGGGPGGLSAGIYAMRAAMKTLLIEKGVPGGQINLSDEVENYPGYEHINGADLSLKFSQHAQSYGLEILTEDVAALDPGLEYHTVKLTNGKSYHAHSVILGTGGSPRKLNIPGEDAYYGKGVSYCAVCDGFFFRNKTVAVIGGGDSATEESLYLAKIAKKVHLIHRRDELRASRILQQRVMNECNIEIIWDTLTHEILADEKGVNRLKLENKKTGEETFLDVEGVFIFIGFDPNNQLVPAGTRMTADGFVVTDEKCETNTPGIFVIGDLRNKYARQIVLSAGDGCTAALAAAHYVETKKASSKDECPAPFDIS